MPNSSPPSRDPAHADLLSPDGAPDAIGPSDGGRQDGGKVEGGSAGDRAAMDFDDDEIYSGRGNRAATGGTRDAQGGDSGRLGPPSEQLSTSNGPSDPDR